MEGVVVWVVARCATGPHPSPLPPSGRGDGCCVRGYFCDSGGVAGDATSARRGMVVVGKGGCCLNRGLRRWVVIFGSCGWFWFGECGPLRRHEVGSLVEFEGH